MKIKKVLIAREVTKEAHFVEEGIEVKEKLVGGFREESNLFQFNPKAILIASSTSLMISKSRWSNFVSKRNLSTALH